MIVPTRIRAALDTSAARNSIVTMFVSGTRPLVTIFTLPLLAAAISNELLGYWLGILALTAVFGCLNTGISSFVVTGIANSVLVKEIVRYAVVIAMACSLLTLLILGIFLVLVDFPDLFQLVETTSRDVAPLIMIVAFLALAIGFPAQIGRFVAIGALEGYKAQVVEMVALMCGALLMILAIFLDQGIVIYATAFMLVPPVVMLLLGGAYVIRRKDPGSFRGPVDPTRLLSSVSEAAPMAGHQGMLAINQHGDVLIIATLLGPLEAALYGIAQRLAVLANYFITPINLAFWPELAKFWADGEVDKLRKYFIIQTSLNLTFALAFATALTLLGNFVIRIWMGEGYTLPIVLLAGISSAIFTFALVNTMEMMLRAQKRFKFLLWCTSIGVMVGLATKGLVALHYGAAGVAWGGTIVMVLLVGLPYTIAVLRSEAFSEVPLFDQPESR